MVETAGACDGSLDRNYEVYVEPLGGQDAEPFFVAATISFRWDSLSTARTATTEEDLREMFHRVRASLTAWMQALDHLKKGARLQPERGGPVKH
jgi:hypothetical protein